MNTTQAITPRAVKLATHYGEALARLAIERAIVDSTGTIADSDDVVRAVDTLIGEVVYAKLAGELNF